MLARFNKHSRLYIFTALSIIVLSAALSLTYLHKNKKINPSPVIAKSSTARKDVITVSTTNPDENKPTAYVWKGKPTEPKKIIIPKIEIDTYLQLVGVDQNKQIGVPTNTNLAGWFIDSARPGELGLSIIDGHVSGASNKGIFYKLDTLKTGDTFTIERGDGVVLTYTVRNLQIVPIDQANNVLFSQDPNIKSQLNLITCGGSYISSQRTFDKRVIVVSELTGKTADPSAPKDPPKPKVPNKS